MKLTSFVLGFGALVVGVPAQTTRNVPGQYPTVQAAINACVNGDTVLIAPGTYSGGINFLGRAITVKGSQPAPATVLLGTAGGRVVTFSTAESAASILRDVKVTGGNGGILIQNASPTITNCIIQSNASTTDGGGVVIHASGAGSFTPTISNCVIGGNSALNSGGGVFADATNGAALQLSCDGLSVVQNGAVGLVASNTGAGGGIYVTSSGTATCALTLYRSTVSQNSAAGNGGGIYALTPTIGSALTILSCRILDNTAVVNYVPQGAGAGIGSVAAQTTLQNTLVAGNVSNSFGGGMLIENSGVGPSASIRGCTFADNVGSSAGVVTQVPLTIEGSIFWGNTGVQVAPTASGAVNVTTSDIQSGIYTSLSGNITADPRFVDAANRDYHLSLGSPCIDVGGSGAGLAATDWEGTARVVGAGMDMGFDEIPAIGLAGSNEDLDLLARINGIGDPHVTSVAAPANSQLRLQLRSPGGTFVGTTPLVFGRAYTTGGFIGTTAGFPTIRFDIGPSFLMFGSFSQPFYTPGLPAAGVTLDYAIPPGLAGTTLRVQGFAVTSMASNALFAASEAHDIVF